ncbi:hypothetical protein ACTFJW_17800 [Clostridium cagae]|uniref:hypothetical protein n=1 Tax=Clostridium cagae TaxID=2080751 RepID=UPI003F773A3C
MNKEKNELEKFIMCFLGALISIALCIAFVFKVSTYGNQLKIDDYFNFTASFGGAILGALISMIILYVTIINNKKENDDKRIEDVMPILEIKKPDTTISSMPVYLNCKNSGTEAQQNQLLVIENIGIGPGMGIKIEVDGKYLKGTNRLDYEFNLGTNQRMCLSMRSKNYSFKEYDDNNQYAEIIIECSDIFNERKYRYKFTGIKFKSHNDIESFLYRGMEVLDNTNN